MLNAGGGRDVARAIAGGSSDVTDLEPNPVILHEVMRGSHSRASEGLYLRPEVHALAEDERSFVSRSTEAYDIIQLTP